MFYGTKPKVTQVKANHRQTADDTGHVATSPRDDLA